MFKYAVFDTETSGLFDFKLAADHETQPRMCSFAMAFLNANLEVENHYSALVKPDGWALDDNCEAAQKNGLTQARLMAEGVPVREILDMYNAALNDGLIMVGFNVSFDLKMMRAELRRAGLPDRFDTTASVDCMRPLTNICKIKKASGGGFKWPKLTEAHQFLFGEGFEGAHGALPDTLAAARVFKHMVANKMLSEQALTGVQEMR
jgi:DNA polymerase-3 subunit epsilon